MSTNLVAVGKDVYIVTPDFLERVGEKAPTLAYLTAKRFRRHWPVLAAATGMLLLLIGMTVTTAAAVALLLTGMAIFSYLRVVAQRTIAERERSIAEHQRGIAEQQTRNSQLSLAHARLSEGEGLLSLGRVREGKQRLEEAHRMLGEQGEQTFVANLLLWCAHHESPPPLLELNGHFGPVRGVASLPGTHQLLTGGRDGTLRLWDYRDGRLLRVIENVGPLNRLTLSSDGVMLAPVVW